MHNLDDDDRLGAADDELTIGAVSSLTGIPAPTIRSWERRHQLPTGRRTAGGERRYSPADVRALTRMRDETGNGTGAAEVAARIRDAEAAPPDRVVELLLSAALRLDGLAIQRELELARHRHGLVVTLERVLLPTLREIGRQWASGRSDVAHEHLLTDVILSWLAVVDDQAPPASRPGPVVLACGPDDRHSLALRAFAVLLAHRGFDCRFLGAQTPAASLTLAARSCGAQAVVLVSHLDRSRPAALAALEYAAGQPWRLYYAGAAFADPRWRRTTPGVYLGETLEAAAQRLDDDAGRTEQ